MNEIVAEKVSQNETAKWSLLLESTLTLCCFGTTNKIYILWLDYCGTYFRRKWDSERKKLSFIFI